MKYYRVQAVAMVNVVTLVEAETEQEAEKMVSGREVDICIHGSEYADGCLSDDFKLVGDGDYSLHCVSSVEEVES